MNSPTKFSPASNETDVNVHPAPTKMRHASSNENAEWKPLLLATGGHSIGGFASDDLLSASKGSVIIKVQNASELSMEKLGQITRLSDAQLAKFPGLLNRFDPQAAMSRDTVFAYAMQGEKLIATVYVIRSNNDEGRSLHIANLNSDSSERGIAVPLTAALILGDTHWAGSPAKAEAVARILPNGEANIGSTKTLMRLGFYAARFFTHPITVRNPQKTALGSVESNGEKLKYLLLRGDAEEVESRSIAVLSDWRIRLGKFKSV